MSFLINTALIFEYIFDNPNRDSTSRNAEDKKMEGKKYQAASRAHKPLERRQKRLEQTKREIREAAARLFLARGFREVTMADIGGAVGMAPATLYYYFANKEAILRDLDKECLNRFEQFLDSLSPKQETLQEWVVAFLRAVFCFARENRDYFAFLTRLVASVHPSLLGELAQNRMRAFQKALCRLTEAMQAFQERGVVRRDIRPEELAHFLGGLVHALMFLWFFGMVDDEELGRRFYIFAKLLDEGVREKA